MILKKNVAFQFSPWIFPKQQSTLLQVKQLNPKIPPASAPHPEPSEYMCLVRFFSESQSMMEVL